MATRTRSQSTERIPGLTISLGESINVPAGALAPLKLSHVRSVSDSGPSPLTPFVSKLPPAVANVPKDDIRGYVHSKRVNSYLVGSTLGEGSFAKVKEAFHVLVGEKVGVLMGERVGLGCCSSSEIIIAALSAVGSGL